MWHEAICTMVAQSFHGMGAKWNREHHCHSFWRDQTCINHLVFGFWNSFVRRNLWVTEETRVNNTIPPTVPIARVGPTRGESALTPAKPNPSGPQSVLRATASPLPPHSHVVVLRCDQTDPAQLTAISYQCWTGASPGRNGLTVGVGSERSDVPRSRLHPPRLQCGSTEVRCA